MMNKISPIFLFGLFACAPLPKDFKAQHSPAHVLLSQEMGIGAQASINIDIGPLAESSKEFRDRIFFLPMPTPEEIGPDLWKKGEAYSLKSIKSGSIYALSPKKKLKAGQYYGLYIRSKDEDKAALTQVLYVKHERPQLIKQDIGSGEMPVVAKNRLIFNFFFDQPIHVRDDRALVLKSSNSELKIDSLTIPFEKNMISVGIAPDQLQLGERYSFNFGTIFNADKIAGEFKAIDFVVGEPRAPMHELGGPLVAVGHESVEISWHLDQAHFSESYFGEDTGLHDCLSQPCPVQSTAIASFNDDEMPSFLSRIYLTKLKPNTSYHLILRALDLQGRVMLASVSFRTNAAHSLRFSEILINPKTPKYGRESKGEFLELYNDLEKDKTTYDLKLIFESIDGQIRRECVLATQEKPLKLLKKSYILVVGQDFDQDSLSLSGPYSLVKLPKKNLCGGLPNDRPFIIKLMGERGALLDRFGGYLWQGKEGQSIARSDPTMADLAENYCFSKNSPGLKNDKASCIKQEDGR